MFCFVTQPNSVLILVDVDVKANGQECLDKVCEKLGIIEVDYFGLQYEGTKGEQLWLNMRNRIAHQLPGHPYKLSLRVKFFVQPHYLLQEETKNIFYLHLKEDFIEDKLHIPDEAQVHRIGALIAQVEHGDFVRSGCDLDYVAYEKYLPARCADCIAQVMQEHAKLCGLQRTSGEYKCLQELASLDCYGMEYYQVKSDCGRNYELGVGPQGVTLYDQDVKRTESIVYDRIILLTQSRRWLILQVLSGGSTGKLGTMSITFKLVSYKAARGLYRCLTEMHSFHRLDTVGSAVSSQCYRDLKGTLASLFNGKTTLGKNYVFDIRRTCREVYDHTRRVLYASANSISLPNSPTHKPSQPLLAKLPKSPEKFGGCDSKDYVKVKEKLETLQDAFLCRICMDSDINTAFCPCGHLVCCQSCAERVEMCPLCRGSIEQIQHIFLPTVCKTHI